MTKTVQGSLTMVGLNTESPDVFWNGVKVANISAIKVDHHEGVNRVVLTIPEESVIAEMREAGIIIKRSL